MALKYSYKKNKTALKYSYKKHIKSLRGRGLLNPINTSMPKKFENIIP